MASNAEKVSMSWREVKAPNMCQAIYNHHAEYTVTQSSPYLSRFQRFGAPWDLTQQKALAAGRVDVWINLVDTI